MTSRLARAAGAAAIAAALAAALIPRTGGVPAHPVLGPLHPVGERDLLAVIEGKVADARASGELGRAMERARERALAMLEAPPPVPGIVAARTARTRVVDPSVTLAADITGPEGEVLFRRGARVNPLDHAPMGDPLLFLDGADPGQVRLAERLLAGREGRLRPVLVAGSWLGLSRRWGRRTYHDQGGALTSRLGIREVPALVEQSGNRLLVRVMVPGGGEGGE